MYIIIVVHIACVFIIFEKIFNSNFIQKRCTQNAEHFKSRPAGFESIFYNSNQTVWGDCTIDLYSNCIFRDSPKWFDMQMLFDPFKEEFNLPPVFIKQSYMRWFNFKVIRKISKGSMMLLTIKNYTTKLPRIFILVIGPVSLITWSKRILSDPSRSSSPWIISYWSFPLCLITKLDLIISKKTGTNR